jgi:hypothetical protein
MCAWILDVFAFQASRRQQCVEVVAEMFEHEKHAAQLAPVMRIDLVRPARAGVSGQSIVARSHRRSDPFRTS